MKKALLIVAMLLLVAPVMATTTITAVQEGAFTADGLKQRTVRIDYSTTVDVRAFALDINIDAGPTFDTIRNFKVGESNGAQTGGSSGYGIFPSRFRDFVTVAPPNWNVDVNYNPTVAWNEPGSTNTGLGYPKMIVELGTLYAGDPNKPATTGTLFRFDVNSEGGVGTYHMTIAANALRGGVVGNDGNTITASYVGTDIVFAADCVTPTNEVGQARAAAEAVWTGQGFTLGTATPVVNCAQVGLIISQDTACVPLPASINYSYGTQATVPNVIGHAEATATGEIITAGLTLGTRTTGHSATAGVGNIGSTNPVANTVTCAAVDYNVATACTVPNVVNSLVADACTAIANAGFVVGAKTYDWSATVAKGRVISQNPASGGQPTCGTVVTFQVSQGPTPVACFDPCGTGFSQQKSQYNMYIAQKWDPNSWCEFPIGSGFQCHGDADRAKTGAPNNYRIYTGDLTLITNNWGLKIGLYPAGANPAADIDHKATGAPNSYRVYTLDLARLTGATTGNWSRKGCPDAGGTLPRNCPMSDAKNNATYVKPAACTEGK